MKDCFRIVRPAFLICAIGLATLGYATTPLYAQGACTSALNSLRAALNACDHLNPNWACYGHTQATTNPADLRFQRPRDRQPVTVFKTINTDAAGAVFFYLVDPTQTTPMAAIAFGGTQLIPVGQRNFLLNITNPAFVCPDTLAGLMVQTESGERGSLTVNGVTIELESTVFITLQPGGQMVVVNLEGTVTLTIPALGVQLPLPLGQQVTITLRAGAPVAVGQPEPSPLLASVVLEWLTQSGLPQVHNSNTTSQTCSGEIRFGETVLTQNAAPGQECLYTFCAQAGETATVQMNTTASDLNPWIDLRLPNDELLKFNNDADDDDRDSLICNRTLPVTGCYTIVARPFRNTSRGQFSLRLERATTCAPPPPRCEVITRGLHLRQGPGTQFPSVQTLVEDTRLRPLQDNLAQSWIQVRVVGTARRVGSAPTPVTWPAKMIHRLQLPLCRHPR